VSKSNPQLSDVYAVIIDDEGEMHEITAYYEAETENMFEAIEQEAKERGIRYANTMMFQFPNEGGR